MFIADKPIPLGRFLSRVPSRSCGAVATFVGIVRDRHGEKRVKGIYYDSYRSMAEKEIAAVIADVKKKVQIDEIRVLHRVGRLKVGQAAVAIWVSAAHREEAFKACRMAIDGIKKRVPIWKQEIYANGSREWVICGHAHEEEPLERVGRRDASAISSAGKSTRPRGSTPRQAPPLALGRSYSLALAQSPGPEKDALSEVGAGWRGMKGR